MSRGHLQQEAESFKNNASWLAKASSYYLVDYAFPSMGVIDLLTSHLRSNFSLSDDDKRLLFQISSFLGEYVVRCWEDAGLDVNVSSDENGVLLSVRGLNVKPIHVNSTFALLLSNLPKEINLDRAVKVPLTAQGDYVCTFIQGLLRGAYFESSEEVDNLFTEEFNVSLDKIIARQYAKWHEFVVPNLTIAHLPELYLCCLKCRHFLASEEAPLVREVNEFVNYFKSLNIDSAMAGRKLAPIFLSSPSEYLAVLGLSLLGSFDLHDPMLSNCLSAANSRAYAIPLIRNAFYKYRLLIGKEVDWIDLDVFTSQHKEMLELDLKLGFLPWLKLSPQFIQANFTKHPELGQFVKLVRQGGFFLAQDLLDKILEKEPGNLELRVQRAFFLFVTKDLDTAHEYCKRLLSEPNIEKISEFFAVWGSILLEMNQFEIAIRYLKLAYNSGDLFKYRKAEVGNDLAWCYILSSMNNDAKLILDEIVNYSSLQHVSILLNLLFISEKTKNISQPLIDAISLAPTDRKVFNNLILLGKARIVKGEVDI